MQVKKFEAKTMKEALEMVKNQLGPDAIILGARDNNKGFGLLGKSSVEITAAISDVALQQKKFVESRMTEKAKVQFRSSPAKTQKQVSEKSIRRYTEQPVENMEVPVRRSLTQMQYSDIDDDGSQHSYSQPQSYSQLQSHSPSNHQPPAEIIGHRVDSILEKINTESPMTAAGVGMVESTASKRIRNAVKSAAQVFETKVEKTVGSPVRADAQEVQRLREEIAHLKQYIGQLQSLPRTFVNAHPGAQLGISYDVSAMFEKLTEGGLSQDIAGNLMKQAMKDIPPEQQKNKNLIEAWTAHQIMNSISIADTARLGRIHIFVGGAGQGKTSALVKLAGHLVGKQKKKVAIIGVGNLRVGAMDQLKIYSHLLNAQVDVVRTGNEWGRILSQYADCDYILADYPGIFLRNDLEVAALKSLLSPFTEERRVHFVQSVVAKDGDANEVFRKYLPFRIDDLIFSHLDESVNHGLIYNLQKNFNCPLFAFGTGPSVPDDFEWATRERVLDLIFKLTKKSEN